MGVVMKNVLGTFAVLLYFSCIPAAHSQFVVEDPAADTALDALNITEAVAAESDAQTQANTATGNVQNQSNFEILQQEVNGIPPTPSPPGSTYPINTCSAAGSAAQMEVGAVAAGACTASFDGSVIGWDTTENTAEVAANQAATGTNGELDALLKEEGNAHESARVREVSNTQKEMNVIGQLTAVMTGF